MNWTKNLLIAALLSLALVLGACGNSNTNITESVNASESNNTSELAVLKVLDESNPDYVPNELRSFQSEEEWHYSILLDLKDELEDDIGALKADSRKGRYEDISEDYALVLYEADETFKNVKQQSIIKKTRKLIKQQTSFNDKLKVLIDREDGLSVLKFLNDEFPKIEESRGEYLENLEDYLGE